MKVIEIDVLVLQQFMRGCKHAVEKEGNVGTYLEGHNRGIDDALALVDNQNDLTFVMRMALLGARRQYDQDTAAYLRKPDAGLYASGYGTGIDDTIRILTGSEN